MEFDLWRYVLPLRLRSLFRSGSVESELDEELQYHLERQIELNLTHGMNPTEARHAALRAVVGVEQHKEACRDRRRVRLVDNMVRDTLYGLRLLRRSPFFTTIANQRDPLGPGHRRGGLVHTRSIERIHVVSFLSRHGNAAEGVAIRVRQPRVLRHAQDPDQVGP